MSYSELTFNRVREYLMNANDEGHGGKTPFGAKPTFWMSQFPQVPKDSYNEVFPGIIIGDHTCGRDKGKLLDLGATHVINCCQGIRSTQVNTDATYFRDAGIRFHGIQASDVNSYDMSPHFSMAAKFIEKALQSGGKVYVHCMSGISRSSTIVLAFLMMKRNMGLMEAVKAIRANRAIFPNEGFLRQLCILENTIQTSKPSL